MMEELKRRIEMINRGEVPDGYKRTESGIVPVEWKETMLRNLLDFKNGINADKEKFGSGIKLISVMDILDNYPITYESIRGAIDIDKETLEKYSVTYGDILFQRSSENFDDAGKSNVYLDKNNTATYSGFVIRGKKIAEYDPFYLNELLKTQDVRKQIIRLSAGSQHINIGQESLAQIVINTADVSEQEKITEILMKWDKLVTLQEKLIDKLEMQRTAIMQKILTPKEYWDEICIKDVFAVTRGQVLAVDKCDDSYKYPVYSSQTLNNGLMGYYNDYLFENSITWTTDGANAGVVRYREGKFYCTNVCGVLVNKEGYANHCIAYLLDKVTRNYVSYIGNPKLMNNVMATIKIKVPSIYEQKEISKLISMLNEYTDLQHKKLIKIKEQQKAVMQLLLTGIVRVSNGGN